VLSYVRTAQLFLQPRLVPHRGHSLIPILVIDRGGLSFISHYHHRLLLLSIVIDQGMTHSRTPSVYMCTDVVGSAVHGGCLFLYCLSLVRYSDLNLIQL